MLDILAENKSDGSNFAIENINFPAKKNEQPNRKKDLIKKKRKIKIKNIKMKNQLWY